MDKALSRPDYLFRFKDCLLGIQTLFIALGALVLVPLLTGLDPSVALFTAGTGTLLFQIITRGKIPIFLGSSFAFVPVILEGTQLWGLPSTLCGLAMGGLVYFALAFLVRWQGQSIIDRILPPIVTGPIILCIGLILAPVAINMAVGLSGDGSQRLFDESIALMIAGVALFTTMGIRLFAKGKLKLVPILAGVMAAYFAAWCFGVVDVSKTHSAAWLQIPTFITPTWHWGAVALIMPVAAISAIEHIGDILAISAVTKRAYVKDPGLHRSLFGDGLATLWAAMWGGPPNTTYSEVTAGVALTRIFNPAVMTWASLAAIGLAFVGKVGLFLQTIPTPAMGGILILLFGAIAVTGLNILVQAKEDLMNPRAMTIIGVILVTTLGGLNLGSGLNGISLGGMLGVILHVILPKHIFENSTNP